MILVITFFLAAILICFIAKFDYLGEIFGEIIVRVIIVVTIVSIPSLITFFFYKEQDQKIIDVAALAKIEQEKITSNLNAIDNKLTGIVSYLRTKEERYDSIQIVLDSLNQLKQEIFSNFKALLSQRAKLDTSSLQNLNDILLESNEEILRKLDSIVAKKSQFPNSPPRITKSHSYSRLFLISPLLLVATIVLLALGLHLNNRKMLVLSLLSGISSLTTKLTIEGKLAFDPQFNIEYINCDTNYSPITSIDILTIGPFKPGYDTLEAEGFNNLAKAKLLLSDTTKLFTEILFIGGVDKRPLKRKALSRFGDNLTLAQMRAIKIKQAIYDEVFNQNAAVGMPNSIISVNGANTYDEKDTLGFKGSRSVKIVARYLKND